MNRSLSFIATTSLAGLIALASCTSEKTPKQTPEAAPATQTPGKGGEAGGMAQQTFTATATVSAIDPATRKITLSGADGTQATFTAGPQVRNFDQIKVGDEVTATVTERLDIFVRPGDGTQPPSASHDAAIARAPKGAKPGALVGEVYEVTATVQSIDTVNRTATLTFVGGQMRTIQVRDDVDLSRYKAGDSVVIRVSAALGIVVETP